MDTGRVTPDQARAGNPRYRLRAYETPDACRLAAVLAELGAGPTPQADTETRWAERWPRHRPGVAPTIPSRISGAIRYLRAAGIAHREDDHLVIDNARLLLMAAGNLQIITTPGGLAIPPARWNGRPVVPDDLRPIQHELARRTPVRHPQPGTP